MRIPGPPAVKSKAIHTAPTLRDDARWRMPASRNGARRSPGASKPCRAHHHRGRRPRLLPRPGPSPTGWPTAVTPPVPQPALALRFAREGRAAQGHDRTWRGWRRNAVTVRRAPSTWPHDGVVRPWKRRLSDDERSVLLSELLLRHPELAAEAEEITSTLLVVENDQKLADEITARLRALRPSGRCPARQTTSHARCIRA
jgi:hypothetical protein